MEIMDRSEITQKVILCVSESLVRPAEGIQADSSIVGQLGADSLDFLDIMFALERAFKISLGKEQFDLLKKVGLSREEAIQGQFLTPAAVERLRKILPNLPLSGDIAVQNLREYITVGTIVEIVEGLLPA
jgi:acyl carrier protein